MTEANSGTHSLRKSFTSLSEGMLQIHRISATFREIFPTVVEQEDDEVDLSHLLKPHKFIQRWRCVLVPNDHGLSVAIETQDGFIFAWGWSANDVWNFMVQCPSSNIVLFNVLHDSGWIPDNRIKLGSRIEYV